MKTNHYLTSPEIKFSADFSYVDFPEGFLESMQDKVSNAIAAMEALENGAIANPDEGRMVGHYWLRAPELAPDDKLTEEIVAVQSRVMDLADKVHRGELQAPAGPFTDLLVIGIGGSALGPQFVSRALGHPNHDKLSSHFFDNTDPDGIDLTLAHLGNRLKTTLAIVISKSGGTPETRNGMMEAEAAFAKQGLDFAKQAIAITGDGSKLHAHATSCGWLDFLPMWDWIGGRTSETSVVGLLPAALQGIDVKELLSGAASMDAITRESNFRKNPASLLALAWYHLTDAKGSKDMVILPYKDRLELFAKYLQQLVMESLGKETDLDGNLVHQGIAVYGNKGSTDQHAYVQQLRDGVPNFFATFIEVLQQRAADGSIEVDEDAMTSGDYLHGFFLGTRDALHENGRKSVTLTIEEVNASSVGCLIALFERAVGFYATLVNVNAYHQPGVEAGKKAASSVLAVRKRVKLHLIENLGQSFDAKSLAAAIGANGKEHWVYKILESLAANHPKSFTRESGENPLEDSFSQK